LAPDEVVQLLPYPPFGNGPPVHRTSWGHVSASDTDPVFSGLLVCWLPGWALLHAAIAPQEATTEIHIPRLLMVFFSLSSLECAAGHSISD
jgi:hypothetical protein